MLFVFKMVEGLQCIFKEGLTRYILTRIMAKLTCSDIYCTSLEYLMNRIICGFKETYFKRVILGILVFESLV